MNKYILIILTLLTFNNHACDEEEKKANCSNSLWNPSSENTSASLERFYALEELIIKQYTSNNFTKARKLAYEYLEMASTHNQNWNYGNAIHDANRILGLISLKEGKNDEATMFLLKSSESKGSPQLDSFGPDLELANLLLKEGEIDAVKTYLTNIKKFWDMDQGAVDVWIKQIENKEVPELNRFGKHLISPKLKYFIWFSLLWPLLVTIGVYIKFHKKLTSWKFIPLAIIGAYVTMIVGGLLSRSILNYFFEIISSSVMFFSVLFTVIQFFLPLALVYWLSKNMFFHKQNN